MYNEQNRRVRLCIFAVVKQQLFIFCSCACILVLVILHAKCVCHIVLSAVACLDL